MPEDGKQIINKKIAHLGEDGHGETPICCCRTGEDRSARRGDTHQGQ